MSSRDTSNEQADTLAKMGLAEPECNCTRATLSWTRTQPRKARIRECQIKHLLPIAPKTRDFEPTANQNRKMYTAIARMRSSLTAADKSPTKLGKGYEGGKKEKLAQPIVLDYNEHDNA